MPYMYILRRADGAFLTGSTWNLSQRLRQHGIESTDDGTSTSPALVYVEWHDRIDEAYYRERQIHGWKHGQKGALIEADGEGERPAHLGQGPPFPAR